MYLGLGAVTMFFAAFTSAYIVRKGLSDDWQTMAMPAILWPNTLVLLASSLVLEKARRCLGDESRFNRWWLAGSGLGLTFLVGQIWAWQQLVDRGVYVSTNPSSSRKSKAHFWTTFIGIYAIFTPMHFLGMVGNPRRYPELTAFDFLKPLEPVHLFISIAAFLTITSQLMFFGNLIWSFFKGQKAEMNPWEATTLEWEVPSPPPHLSLLVLRSSRGLHCHPSRNGGHLTHSVHLRPQARLWIPGHGLRPLGHRDPGLHGVGTSHVRQRNEPLYGYFLLLDDHGHCGSLGH